MKLHHLSTVLILSMGLLATFALPASVYAQSIPPAAVTSACNGIDGGGAGIVQANSGGTYTCSYTPQGGSLNTRIFDGSGAIVAGGTVNTIAGSYAEGAGGKLAQNAVKCSSWGDTLSNPGTCMFRAFAAGFGSVLITLTAYLLELVGLLFNWLVYYTIIAFGDQTNGFLTTGVLSGINQTWSAFRDIANILIIGLFTFVAISTILGLKEFGAKKMIARVLIIAVLINFSLLFTKIIIDGSNFVAYQFYNASGNYGGPGDGSTGSAARADSTTISFTTNGIAGQFINYMGVTSLSNTFGSLKDGADTANSGWSAILHGIFGATLLLSAAIVLLYGCFLLVSRAILVVFLLITSSLAFASHLIPKFSDSTFGWSGWWSSLIKSAVFAPLLLMFLWATLTMASALRPSGGTLGALITDPTNGGNLSSLFGYVIILGLLFASFKISSSFASSIGGFNFAAMIPAIGVSMASRVAGFAGRQAIGRPALYASDKMREAANKPGRSTFASSLFGFGARGLKGVAKRDFNALRVPGVGAAVADASGLKLDTLTGKLVKGYEGSVKNRADKFAKKAEGVAITDDERDKMRREALNSAATANPGLAQARKTAEETVRTATRGVATATQNQVKAVEEIGNKIVDLEKQRETALRSFNQNPSDTARKQEVETLNASIEHTKSQQKEVMREQDSKIKEAHRALTEAKAAHTSVNSALAEVAKGMGKWDAKLDQSAQARTADMAEQLAHNRFSNILLSASGITTPDNDRLAKLARKQVGERKKKEDIHHAIEALKHVGGEEEGKPHAPAAKPKSAPEHKTPAADHAPSAGGDGHAH